MVQGSEEICVAVTETVSDALETPIEDLPPLSKAVDVDALDTLVTSTDAGSASDVVVTFTYSGLDVLVHSEAVVYVRPIRDHDEEPACWYPN